MEFSAHLTVQERWRKFGAFVREVENVDGAVNALIEARIHFAAR
jgi:hypothetical protein